ncbi:MAG: Ig-like domain-containing protein [bacterium]
MVKNTLVILSGILFLGIIGCADTSSKQSTAEDETVHAPSKTPIVLQNATDFQEKMEGATADAPTYTLTAIPVYKGNSPLLSAANTTPIQVQATPKYGHDLAELLPVEDPASVENAMPAAGQHHWENYPDPYFRIVVNFSKPMDRHTITMNTVNIYTSAPGAPAGSMVRISPSEYSEIQYGNSKTFNYNLDSALTPYINHSTVFTVVLQGGPNGVKDEKGKPIEGNTPSGDYSWNFTIN